MSKVLLVEDDVSLSDMYSQILFREGIEVVVARDKEAGLNLALSENIDFILLDYMLAEDTNGMELLEDLRKDEEGRKIPVVMLTNVVKDEERKRALDLGAKEYLPKAQQDPAAIVAIVKKYLPQTDKTS